MSQIEKTRAEIILEQQAEIADLKRQLAEARKDTERRIEEYQRKTILPPCESISMRHLDRRGRVSKGIIKMLGGCSCDNCLDLERGAIDAAREGK